MADAALVEHHGDELRHFRTRTGTGVDRYSTAGATPDAERATAHRDFFVSR
jgi:hypothetical protein